MSDNYSSIFYPPAQLWQMGLKNILTGLRFIKSDFVKVHTNF